MTGTWGGSERHMELQAERIRELEAEVERLREAIHEHRASVLHGERGLEPSDADEALWSMLKPAFDEEQT